MSADSVGTVDIIAINYTQKIASDNQGGRWEFSILVDHFGDEINNDCTTDEIAAIVLYNPKTELYATILTSDFEPKVVD